MKTLTQFITEKLKVGKNTVKREYITLDQLLMLYVYCSNYFLHDDLIKKNTIDWGEIERDTKYDIDFYKDTDARWITEYGCDNSKEHEGVVNAMDKIGQALLEIMKIFIDGKEDDDNIDTPYKYFDMLCIYIFTRIKEHSNESKIKLRKTDRIVININNTKKIVGYSKLWWDTILNYDTNIESYIDTVYQTSKELVDM